MNDLWIAAIARQHKLRVISRRNIGTDNMYVYVNHHGMPRPLAARSSWGIPCLQDREKM